MTTITLPPDLERSLIEEAHRQGTTPELLAVECLRKLFVSMPVVDSSAADATLYDFLSGYVGLVDGTTEALSEHCGQRFAQGLVEQHQRGRV